MRALLPLLLLATPAAAQAPGFDGVWGVTITCTASADATGYRLQFPARIAGGMIQGQNGEPGKPGYLLLQGRVEPGGAASLTGDGLVGSPRTAIGQLASTTPYHFLGTARFAGNQGTGQRTTTRPCSIDFTRS